MALHGKPRWQASGVANVNFEFPTQELGAFSIVNRVLTGLF